MAIGKAGQGADKLPVIRAAKHSGFWMELDVEDALAQADVPLFAIIFNFGQLRHPQTISIHPAGAIMV